ncbi:MAG: formate dehydrogenase subunit gamma [Proteobacteria bacterium]|nr:formate dehydrogenase subunit gamma [Pseudomonadota bacterium]
MRITLAGLRHFLLGLMLFLPVITGAAYAQTKGAPASQAQSPESRAAESRAAESQAQRQQVQPGNNAPTWREARSGKEEYTSVKGRETGVLIQNDGQTWRKLRNGPIMFYGGWAVVLMLIVLGVFYKVNGPIGLHSAPAGKMIERFSAFERIAHWAMAISFCILGVSGLVMLFGKFLLLPLIGHTLFGWLATLGKNLHNFVGPIFMFSVLVFIVTFIRDNLPRLYDFIWLVKGGGVLTHEVVPCGRFNAGEKIWFWGGVIGLGMISSASGLVLDFPNFDQPRWVMMIANVVHTVAALWYIVWALTHMYLGTAGTTGAYDGMRNGYVDETWAKEHAQYWYEDVKAGRRELPSGKQDAAPATTAPQTQS